MDDWLWLAAGLAGGALLYHLWRRWREQRASSPPGPRPPKAYQIASELEPFYRGVAHPSHLLSHERFEEGCRVLGNDPTPEVLRFVTADNQVLACMALETLARRDALDDGALEAVFRSLSENSIWARFFALRAIDRHAREPAVPGVLERLDTSWNTAEGREIVTSFVRSRKEKGETPRFERLGATGKDDRELAAELLREVDGALGTRLEEEFQEWNASSPNVDQDFLGAFGRLIERRESEAEEIVEVLSVSRAIERIERALTSDPPRSVLLAGPPGTGKTSIARALSRRLGDAGWTILEAGGEQVLAGQSYIGELEERVRRLLELGRQSSRFLWRVPSFHHLVHSGRHRFSSVSILDMVFPALERGEIRLLGEASRAGLEQVLQARPEIRTAVEIVRLEPATREETLEIARLWSDRVSPPGMPLAGEAILQEAYELAREFRGERANPGALLELLRLTRERIEKSGQRARSITADDLVGALGQLTGLPEAILDDRRTLDIDSVRGFFERRVVGQSEAVDCLVERVAMIKAGLTDPTRPQGVFLFTGPTGTGKTEIAKTTAEYLFGSPARMIRLDMSEFQTWDSFARLLGGADRPDTESLVRRIREQPFSVILLDELEKAHERIWDVFLQVFDDARLTDGQGNVADCRHAIFILTSNVATEASDGDAIGFKRSSSDSSRLYRELSKVFRREFLNRIDRIVSFRPLSRQVMREVLLKELDLVLDRRGLRRRQWAVEWDGSALDFLLSRGFSNELGARPLKRAIDRYLLAPLAATIVEHRFPEGDQFLFVRSNGERIEVEFVDPDAPEPGAEVAPSRDAPPPSGELDVESLVLAARGSTEEVSALTLRYEELRSTVEDDAWRARKHELLEAMSSPDFWSSAGRFGILGETEYRDRIEAGVKTAGSLLGRLVGRRPGGRTRYSSPLVRRLAEQVYLMREAIAGLLAGEPHDAYILVAGTRDSLTDPAATDRFAARIAAMYRRWAARRHMTLEVLDEHSAGGRRDPYRFVAAISGYAAYRLLRGEAGFHVLELPDASPGSGSRCRVRVAVAPQPVEPPSQTAGERLARAVEAVGDPRGESLGIVRRYREEPSPLVRDSARGWRSGRIEEVLDGNFDLMG